MKLHGPLVVSFALMVGSISAVDIDDPLYEIKRSWTMPDLGLPGRMGGMFFDPYEDILYLVANSEASSSALYALTVDRDQVSHEIVGLEDPELVFRGDPVTSQTSGLTAGWAFGPDRTLFYPYGYAMSVAQRPGGLDGVERLFDLTSTGLAVPAAAGVTFSPYIIDPATEFGMMQLTDWTLFEHRVWNVPLKPLADGYFEPQRAEVLVTLPSIAGDLAYIPSGPNAGDLLVADWNGGEINLVLIDKTTGFAFDTRTNEPTLGTTAPEFERFAGGMGNGPWGLEFDPLTNDLFFSTAPGIPENTLFQVGGFPPPPEDEVKMFPTARFVADPETGEAPLEVRFDASSSSVATGANVSKYEWDFGDGTTGEGERLSHTYASAARYLVTLRVTDDRGLTDRERRALEVRCISSDLVPWELVAVGEPAFQTSARFEGRDGDRCLLLCAGGEDISGLSTETEVFDFIHVERTGDATLTAQVSELVSPDRRAKVGIMFRESLEAGAPFAFMLVENRLDGQGRFRFSAREEVEGRIRTRQGVSTDLPDAWIQLRREGSELIGLSSTDGVDWTVVNSATVGFRSEEWFAGVVALGNDVDPSAPFEPLNAKVCHLEFSSDDPGGPAGGMEFLDLSDIVAGGNGDGEPEDAIYAGIHLDTGEFLEFWENARTFESNGVNPSPVAESDFVDSVFFLDQADMPINTAGVTFSFDPVDAFDSSWNHVLANVTGDLLFANGVIQAGDRTDLETCVGLIAAAGVTFDLEALRSEHGTAAIHTFSSYIGMDGGRDGCQNGGFMTLLVLFSTEDEVLMDPTTEDGAVWKLRVPRGVGAAYEAVIPPEATFLSLVSGAGNSDFGCDHGVFGDARILPRPETAGTTFRRGDPTSDGTANVSDAVSILNFLFASGVAPACMKSADVDGNGAVNITDPVGFLNFLFGGGAAPAAPFGACGTDAENDGLTCDSYPPCAG